MLLPGGTTIPRLCKLEFFLSTFNSLRPRVNSQEWSHNNGQELHHQGETGLVPHSEGKEECGSSISQYLVIKVRSPKAVKGQTDLFYTSKGWANSHHQKDDQINCVLHRVVPTLKTNELVIHETP